MRNFGKSLAIAAAIALASSPCFAKFGSSSYGGSSFGGSRSSFSSSSYSSRSYSSPSYSSPSYSSSNTYSSSASSPSRYGSAGYNYRPSITNSRPIGLAPRASSSNIIVHQGYGYGYGGHFLNNPFFWLWAMNNHNNQPVIVNGGGYGGMQGYAQPGYYGPSLLGTVISWLVFLGILGGIGFAVYWIFFRKKNT